MKVLTTSQESLTSWMSLPCDVFVEFRSEFWFRDYSSDIGELRNAANVLDPGTRPTSSRQVSAHWTKTHRESLRNISPVNHQSGPPTGCESTVSQESGQPQLSSQVLVIGTKTIGHGPTRSLSIRLDHPLEPLALAQVQPRSTEPFETASVVLVALGRDIQPRSAKVGVLMVEVVTRT